LQRVVQLLEHHNASIVTAVPRQVVGSWMERLVVPLLHVTYTSWLPLALVWASADPRFVAANGQIVGIRRSALTDIGGFESIKDQVVDDMALCLRAKERGHRVVFADGHHMANCRMYRSASEVWQGFSKNIFEGLGESVLALTAVSVLYILAFVAPYVLAIASVWLPQLRPLAITVLSVALLSRIFLAIRHRHPVSSVVFHPIGVLVLIAIAWNSMRWSRNGAIRWAGRTYPRLSSRDTP
jgi:chlorobactene glucosyltransferase